MAKLKEQVDEDASRSAPRSLQVPTSRGFALPLMAMVAGTFALHQAQEVFIPIVLSILISYAPEARAERTAARPSSVTL